jgi:hypothetical protein
MVALAVAWLGVRNELLQALVLTGVATARSLLKLQIGQAAPKRPGIGRALFYLHLTPWNLWGSILLAPAVSNR